MSWLDDRLKEERDLDTRRASIVAEAPKLYQELWKQLMGHVKEARARQIELLTNGSEYHRVIRRPVMPAPDERGAAAKEVQIELGDDRASILVSGEFNLRFALDLGSDGVVRLTIDGEPATVEGAAIKILDRLLFPELPRKL